MFYFQVSVYRLQPENFTIFSDQWFLITQRTSMWSLHLGQPLMKGFILFLMYCFFQNRIQKPNAKIGTGANEPQARTGLIVITYHTFPVSIWPHSSVMPNTKSTCLDIPLSISLVNATTSLKHFHAFCRFTVCSEVLPLKYIIDSYLEHTFLLCIWSHVSQTCLATRLDLIICHVFSPLQWLLLYDV